MELETDTTFNESLEKNDTENEQPNYEKPLLEESVDRSKDTFSNLNITANNDEATSEDIIKNSPWTLNQLAWARMSIYPFWPCAVTPDPDSVMMYQKVSTVGKSKTLMIHVHFFNDHNRHSWVPAHHMIPFKGIEEFRKRASLVTDVIRKKEPKFAAALTVKPSLFKRWQLAVAEAMDVLYEIDTSTLESFKTGAKDSSPNNNVKKRKRKELETKIVRKHHKQSNGDDSSINENGEDELNLETPPVSPHPVEDLRKAALRKKKRMAKMIDKLDSPDFEVYRERSYPSVRKEYPDVQEEHIQQYLTDMWEHMTPREKLKFRSTYKISDDR